MKTVNHFFKIITIVSVLFSLSFSECKAQESKNDVENLLSSDSAFLRAYLIAHLSDIKTIIEGMEESRSENTRNIASKMFEDREGICETLLIAAQKRNMSALNDSLKTELEKIYSKSKALRKKFMQKKSMRIQEAIAITSIEEPASNTQTSLDETSSVKKPDIKLAPKKDQSQLEKEAIQNAALIAGGESESIDDKKWNANILTDLNKKEVLLKEESAKQYSQDILEVISTMQNLLNAHKAIFLKK